MGIRAQRATWVAWARWLGAYWEAGGGVGVDLQRVGRERGCGAGRRVSCRAPAAGALLGRCWHPAWATGHWYARHVALLPKLPSPRAQSAFALYPAANPDTPPTPSPCGCSCYCRTVSAVGGAHTRGQGPAQQQGGQGGQAGQQGARGQGQGQGTGAWWPGAARG